ncbi:NUDIX hydrolase domain-like protein [Blastocladiella britannica]|nr:NUDIX hydrolase domain-like protein [Blastocladiella britannica]
MPFANPTDPSDVAKCVARLRAHVPAPDDFPRPNKAGVLAPLFHCQRRGLVLIMTQRSTRLRSHSGEVAFPGGKWDPTDASILATALRESHEEIGLHPSDAEYLTTLQPNVSRINSIVYPVVAAVYTRYWNALTADDLIAKYLVANEAEVNAIFAVPLATFMNDGAQHSSFTMHWLRSTWQFHEFMVPWQLGDGGEDVAEFRVWGLTAGFSIALTMIAMDAAPEYQVMAPGQRPPAEMVQQWRDSAESAADPIPAALSTTSRLIKPKM